MLIKQLRCFPWASNDKYWFSEMTGSLDALTLAERTNPLYPIGPLLAITRSNAYLQIRNNRFF